jgi:hypothetical protein
MRRIIQVKRLNFSLFFVLPLRVGRTSKNIEKENYILSHILFCHDGDNEDSRLLGYNICSRVNMYRRFSRSCVFASLDWTLARPWITSMEETGQPEMLVPIYQATRRNVPEDSVCN